MLFPFDLISAYRTNEVDGMYEANEALEILLADTGLEAVSSDTGTLTIRIGQAQAEEIPGVRTNIRQGLFAAILGLFGAGQATTGMAQQETGTGETGGVIEIEEVIVTAQYREQSVQDVPIAMTAYGAEKLDEYGVAEMWDISKIAPDFHVRGDEGFSILTMRGLQMDGNGESTDQALTFNIDGEYINRGTMMNASMFDLERVEILRGPQGTLYGRNATGGAINVITRKPVVGETDGSVSAEFGNYSSQKVNAAVNFSLGETAAIRVAGMLAEHDGYVSHSVEGFDPTGTQDRSAVRVGLKFEPTDELSIYLAAETSQWDIVTASGGYSYYLNAPHSPQSVVDMRATSGCDASLGWIRLGESSGRSICQPLYTTHRDALDPEDFIINAPLFDPVKKAETDAFRAEINYELEAVDITYRIGTRDAQQEGTGAGNSQIEYAEEYVDNTSHELRFSGETDGGLFWQTGAFFFSEGINNAMGRHNPNDDNDIMGPGSWAAVGYIKDFESISRAVFGQVEIPFGDTLTGVLGARYTDDEKSGLDFRPPAPRGLPGGVEGRPPAENDPDPEFSSFANDEATWNLGLNYQPDAGTLHYAKVNRGYKAGGFDAAASFDSELVTSYELGSKNQFGNHTLNANLFYMDYEDMQAAVFLSVDVGTQIFNAGEAEIFGAELEYLGTLFDGAGALRITANFLSAEYTDFSNGLSPTYLCSGRATPGPPLHFRCDAAGIIYDPTGNELPNAPDSILTLGYDHIWDVGEGTLTGSVFSRFKGSYYSTVFNYEDGLQDSYTQTDVSIAYRPAGTGADWSVMAYARNLEDERPLIRYRYFAAGPSNLAQWNWGAPRTFGLRFNYNFN